MKDRFYYYLLLELLAPQEYLRKNNDGNTGLYYALWQGQGTNTDVVNGAIPGISDTLLLYCRVIIKFCIIITLF